MSINIDWSKLLEDDAALETKIRDFLHDQFQRIELPPFIQSLSVPSIKLGTTAPEVTIRHISDPFPEFYEEDDSESGEDIASNEAEYDSGDETSHLRPGVGLGLSDEHVAAEVDIDGTKDGDVPWGRRGSQFRADSFGSQTVRGPSGSAAQDLTRENLFFSSPRERDDIEPYQHDPPSSLMSPNGPLSRPFARAALPSGALNYSRLGQALPQNGHSSSFGGTTPTEEVPPSSSSTSSLVAERLPTDAARGISRAMAEGLASGLSAGIYDPRGTVSGPGNPEVVPDIDDDKVSPFDLQMFVELKYNGDLQIGVSATLLVNYPSPSFISLPLEFQVRGLEIHSLAVLAFLNERVRISILCDIDDNDQMLSEDVKVVRSLKMESRIGDSSDHGAVLRNVGRVEKFILEQLRRVIRDEVVWPGWITLEL